VRNWDWSRWSVVGGRYSSASGSDRVLSAREPGRYRSRYRTDHRPPNTDHRPPTTDPMHPCEAHYLGRVPYAEALARQEALVAQRKRDETPDTLLLLEHPHVITLGRAANRANSRPCCRRQAADSLLFSHQGRLRHAQTSSSRRKDDSDFADQYDDWIALPLTPAQAKAVHGVKVTKAWSLPSAHKTGGSLLRCVGDARPTLTLTLESRPRSPSARSTAKSGAGKQPDVVEIDPPRPESRLPAARRSAEVRSVVVDEG